MFKDRLREARKKAGMTQKEVAAALGIDDTTYCGYETGKRQHDALRIKELARCLNTSGDYLLELSTVEGQKSSLSSSDNLLLRLFHQLNEEGQEKLLDYADDLVQSEKYNKKTGSGVLDREA